MTEITEARKDSTSNPTVKIFRLIEIMILGSIVCLFILIAAKPDIADATLSFCGIKITIGKQEILKQLNDIIEHRREPELEKIQILIREHISKLKFDNNLLSKEMRRLQREGLGPFQEYSKEVQVIWSPQTESSIDPIKEGSAAICENDILYHEDLMFFNRSNNIITLRAAQPLVPCKPSMVYISFKDASKLLSNDPELLRSNREYRVTVLGYAKAPEPVMAPKSDMLKLAGD